MNFLRACLTSGLLPWGSGTNTISQDSIFISNQDQLNHLRPILIISKAISKKIPRTASDSDRAALKWRPLVPLPL